MTFTSPALAELDPVEVRDWLARAVDPTIDDVDVTALTAGYSNGAWRVGARRASGVLDLVLKAPRAPSVVHAFDATREGRMMDELVRRGAPLPAVRAFGAAGEVTDGPCFAMDWIPGRSVADTIPTGYHGAGWFRDDTDPEAQRAIWESFHDRLADLHRTPADGLDELRHGDGGLRGELRHWRDGVLDVVRPDQAGRQLAAIDWMVEHVPAGADDTPVACMGDARLVNCIVDRDRVQALVDFEIVYLGNPAADVAYSLFFDERQRAASDDPVGALPSADETWQRWSAATGRPTGDRDYWAAFAAMVLSVTATRAIVQWGGPAAAAAYRDDQNPVVASWEAAVARASGG